MEYSISVKFSLEDLHALKACKRGIQMFHEIVAGNEFNIAWTPVHALWSAMDNKYDHVLTNQGLIPALCVMSWDGQDMSSLEIRRVEFGPVIFRGVQLNRCTLVGTVFTGARWSYTVGYNAIIRYSDFSGVGFREVELDGCTVDGSTFNGAFVEHVSFATARMSDTAFNGLCGNHVTFREGRLLNCQFANATLWCCVFDDAIMTRIDMSAAKLTRCVGRRSQWKECSFREASMQGCIFSEAVLCGVAFNDAVLIDCKFDAADLRGATFTGARILGCDFTGALRSVADQPINGWTVVSGKLTRSS